MFGPWPAPGVLEDGNVDYVRSAMQSHERENNVMLFDLGVSSLFNPVDENAEATEEVTLEYLGLSIVAVDPESSRNDGAASEEDHMVMQGLYSVYEILKGLAVTVATLDRLGMLDEDMNKRLRGIHPIIRMQNVSEMAHTTIIDHFKIS